MTETKKPAGPLRFAPVITLDAKFFWDHANKEEFVVEQCTDCCALRYPPRPMCPQCNSVSRKVKPLSGKGKVYSWIRPMHPKAMGFAEPPTVALIELEEGFRMVSNVVDCAFEDVTAGMPVEVTFVDVMNKKKLPVFKPVEA